MAEILEQVIQRLLVPDSEAIKQATVDLKRLLKEPGVVAALCELVARSQHSQVRQYAAVLLRRTVLKRRQWKAMSPDVARDMRANLLRVTFSESDRSAQRSLTQLVATIAKHDLPTNQWPELMATLETGARSGDSRSREAAMLVLSAVASTAHEHLNKQLSGILKLCGATLGDPDSHMVVYYSLLTLTHLVPSAGTQALKPWQLLVAKMLEGVRRLGGVDQDLAAEAMEVFDELVETEVPILQPYVQVFVQFCLEVAQSPSSSSKVVVKALSLVAAIVRQKKKVIVKLNLIAPILSALYPIMCREGAAGCSGDAGGGGDMEDELEEAHTPEALAAQVVDTMALHLPPEKFVSALLKFVTPSWESSLPPVRRAAFIALAVSAEGCGDHLKTKHLDKLLPRAYAGLADLSAEVRNAALFALGQFSEHLQPQIAKHSATLLPLLFESLRQTAEPSGGAGLRPKDVTRTYYAVEMFCENLGDEIVPYLGDLVGFLLSAVDGETSGEVKELSISALSSAAAAAGPALVPYFPRIQASLERFLAPTEDETALKVQLQAVEALGVLAQTLGEHFRPLAIGCVTLGLGLIDKTADPDLRRCVYSLFGAVSTILRQEMAPWLEVIVRRLVDCLRSVEGVTAKYAGGGDEEDARLLAMFDDEEEEIGEEEKEEDGEEEEDEDERVESVDIATPFIDEKEDACLALGTLSKSTTHLFLPYLDEVFSETLELLQYPVSDLRKAAVSTAGDLCCAVALMVDPSLTPEGQVMTPSVVVARPQGVELARLQAGLADMLGKVVPRLLELVRTDEVREVAMGALEALNEMLKVAPSLRQPSGPAGVAPATFVLGVVKEVIQRKVKCQAGADPDDLDDDEAEIDSMLIEHAGDILPTLAALLGPSAFSTPFSTLVPDLMKKLRKSASVAEKSFAIGVFAETLDKMGSGGAAGFVARLFPVFTAAATDEDEEVRNNAAYGLGVLAANGGADALRHYPAILALLTRSMATETDERVKDNVCGAVCRMITACPTEVPIGDFLPGIIARLPLKTDIEENATVFRCLMGVWGGAEPGAPGREVVVGAMPRIVEVAGGLLARGAVSRETRAVVVGAVRSVGAADPAAMATVVEAIGEEAIRESLRGCFVATTTNGVS